MISKNKKVNGQWAIVNGQWSMVNGQKNFSSKTEINGINLIGYQLLTMGNRIYSLLFILLSLFLVSCATCKYSFKDVSIPVEVKTFRVNFLENKARYINPNLSPQLTEKLKEKVRNNTRLTQVNDDNAHYDISGYVSDYSFSTSGISGNTASSNRLSVTFHLVFKNTLDDKKSLESDVSSTFDFPSDQTPSQLEANRNDEIVKNIVDAIFNKIFSNW